ncbi:hypothetical protein DXG03_007607, partial [Asterophora parasitica]
SLRRSVVQRIKGPPVAVLDTTRFRAVTEDIGLHSEDKEGLNRILETLISSLQGSRRTHTDEKSVLIELHGPPRSVKRRDIDVSPPPSSKRTKTPALQVGSNLYDALNPSAKKSVREHLLRLKPLHDLASMDMRDAQYELARYKEIEKVLQSTNGKVRNPKKYSFGPLPRPKDGLEEWLKVVLRAAQTYQRMFGMTAS